MTKQDLSLPAPGPLEDDESFLDFSDYSDDEDYVGGKPLGPAIAQSYSCSLGPSYSVDLSSK
jgi:hypothetical protein